MGMSMGIDPVSALRHGYGAIVHPAPYLQRKTREYTFSSRLESLHQFFVKTFCAHWVKAGSRQSPGE